MSKTFKANDAFAYVDTFRQQRLNPPSEINNAKDKMYDEILGMEVVPSRNWAEYRAIEHALAYKLEKKEPGLVLLGEGDPEEDNPEAAGKKLEQMRKQQSMLEGENSELKKQLRHAHTAEQELQATIVERKQEIARLERKLAQNYSTLMVLSTTGIIVFIVLLSVLIFKP